MSQQVTIEFLGTGTSTGVPEVGCTCKVCTSTDAADNRLRTSALLRVAGLHILLDCSPDFRQQLLRTSAPQIDAVLLTHSHYDHVGGLDDLRPFCRYGAVSIYAKQNVVDDIRNRIPYCFASHRYPGVPNLELETIDVSKPFKIGEVEITPIRAMHYKLPIVGYRIGDVAYITDMLYMPDEEFEKLKGVRLLVVNALRIEKHLSHQNLEQAIGFAQQVAAEECYFIHMSHQIGLHKEVSKLLPPHVHFAYDGLVVTLD